MLFFLKIKNRNNSLLINSKSIITQSTEAEQKLDTLLCLGDRIVKKLANSGGMLDQCTLQVKKTLLYSHTKKRQCVKYNYKDSNFFNFLFVKYKYNNRITSLSTYGSVTLNNFRGSHAIKPLFNVVLGSLTISGASRFVIYLNFFKVQNNFLYNQGVSNLKDYISMYNKNNINTFYFYFNFKSSLGLFKHYKSLRNIKKNRYKILKKRNRGLQNMK